MCSFQTTPVRGLSNTPLDAAADFHATWLPIIRHAISIERPDALTLVFEPAGPEHRGWRLAAVQELARELAPARVNAIASNDEAAMSEALDYLWEAPGITGQLLSLESG